MPKASRVDLDLALEAVSNDLDAIGAEVAEIRGEQVEQGEQIADLRNAVGRMDHKLETLIDLIRERILPATDEVDPLRKRVTDVEDRVHRHLHVVPGE